MQTVRRLRQDFIPTHYDLSLNIDRQDRSFNGLVTLHGASSRDGQLSVHAKDLTIKSATLNGKRADFSSAEHDEIIIAHSEITDGAKQIVAIEFEGKITDQMHGMYPCYFKHDGQAKELIATQFESHHAREVFPCIDEPGAKATFDVTLTTEADITVLGNMPVKKQTRQDDKLVTTFEKTPVMSSYLLAWVFGEMHKKSATSKSGVEVNIWATPAQPDTSLDFALDIACRAIDFFNDYFGIAYPLPKSDHVALPDFTSGAMENWGLITYREVALLAEPGTVSISSKQRIATVICHELSHQWFGNLVTMEWWDNLWLNESFANLMEYVAVDALEPSWNIWFEFASYEVASAMRRDAIDGVQPVQIAVNHPDEINALFDPAIVYAKGSCLLHMLERYIGKEAFRNGLREYFKTHAYGNTEADDLWSALKSSSGKDVVGLMHAWISESGYPVVHVSPEGISQEQFFVGPHAPSSKTWPIPLGANTKELPELFNEASVPAKLDISVRLNTEVSSHFVTHYDEQSFSQIINEIETGKIEPLGRLQRLNEQVLLARGGVVSSATLITLLKAYKNETAESVWDVLAASLGELKKFVEHNQAAEDSLRALAGELARKNFDRLGWEQIDDEPDEDTKLRSTILGLMAYSENQDIIDKAFELYESVNLEELDAELRPLILSIVMRHSKDRSVFTNLLAAYQSTPAAETKLDICAGLTSTREENEISILLDAIKDPEVIKSQDAARWFVYLIRNRYGREQTWQWLQKNWEWVEKTFGGDKSYDDYPRYSASGLRTTQQLEEYKSFFAPMREEPSLTRAIDIGVREIEGRIELLERDTDDVVTALID